MATGSYSYYKDPNTGKETIYNAVSKSRPSGSNPELGDNADRAKRLIESGYSTDEAMAKVYGAGGSQKSDRTLSPYEEIKRQQAALLAAQKRARIQALSGQRDSAISALGAEEKTVAPQYLKQRGTLSTSAQQSARGQEQMLAARGLTRGGSAVQGDIARNVALQQGMTDIGEAEAGTLANIAQRRTQAEQVYAQGVAQAESEAAATAAENQIKLLMQAQETQEATVAEEAKRQFELEKMTQALANDKQLAELRIEADKAMAEGDFSRAKELEKYKNDLEAETIKLRASTKSSGGGGGGGSSTGSASDLNITQRSMASSLVSRIEANPGQLSAILSNVSDPAVKAYLMQIYGAGTSQSTGALSDYPTSRTIPGTTTTVPSWLNTRNLPGLG